MLSPSTHDLVHSIAKFNRIVQALEEIQFGEIAINKSFTFGHPCLKSQSTLTTNISKTLKLSEDHLSQRDKVQMYLMWKKADLLNGILQCARCGIALSLGEIKLRC